jgi:hypothetical protein
MSQVCVGEKTSHPINTNDGASTFFEAGEKQPAGDTLHEATSDQVEDLRSKDRKLKEVAAEIMLKNRDSPKKV